MPPDENDPSPKKKKAMEHLDLHEKWSSLRTEVKEQALADLAVLPDAHLLDHNEDAATDDFAPDEKQEYKKNYKDRVFEAGIRVGAAQAKAAATPPPRMIICPGPPEKRPAPAPVPAQQSIKKAAKIAPTGTTGGQSEAMINAKKTIRRLAIGGLVLTSVVAMIFVFQQYIEPGIRYVHTYVTAIRQYRYDHSDYVRVKDSIWVPTYLTPEAARRDNSTTAAVAITAGPKFHIVQRDQDILQIEVYDQNKKMLLVWVAAKYLTNVDAAD